MANASADYALRVTETNQAAEWEIPNISFTNDDGIIEVGETINVSFPVSDPDGISIGPESNWQLFKDGNIISNGISDSYTVQESDIGSRLQVFGGIEDNLCNNELSEIIDLGFVVKTNLQYL